MMYRILFAIEGNTAAQLEFFDKALRNVKKIIVVMRKQSIPYSVETYVDVPYPRLLTESDAIITFERDPVNSPLFNFRSYYDESNVRVLAQYMIDKVIEICKKTNPTNPPVVISYEVVKSIHHGQYQ